MSFSLEDQYQQYLYPTEPNYSEEIPKKIPKRVKKPANTKLLLLNKKSKANQRLIKFLKRNLDLLNSKNIIFEWVVVYDDEIDYYDEQNINEFPLLIYNKQHIVGVNSIIDFLHKIIEPPAPKRTRERNIQAPQDEDEVRNYLLSEVKNDNDDDMDDDDMFRNTITQRIAAMNSARKTQGQHTISMSNPEIHDRMARTASKSHNYKFDQDEAPRFQREQPTRQISQRADNVMPQPFKPPSPAEIAAQTSNGSADDELMLGFWENLEETDMSGF